MHGIDFLSSEPKSFIFHKRSNKTNLGGVLSILYLLVFLIIAISYLVFYSLKDNYSIEYISYETIYSWEEYKEMFYDPRYDPTLYFEMYVFEEDENSNKKFNNRFLLFNRNDKYNQTMNSYAFFNSSVGAFQWTVLYDCLGKNTTTCQIEQNLTQSNEIQLMFRYLGFKLDHQNTTSPLYIRKDRIYNYQFAYKFDYPMIMEYQWNIIKYNEEKGFFSIFDKLRNKKEDDDKIIGITNKKHEIKDITTKYGLQEPFFGIYDVNMNKYHYYKIIGEIDFAIDYNHYEEYKRTPKSFWDTVANICSLSLTVFNGFTFIFVNYYSNNFDNYKIVEKILFNRKPEINKNNIKKNETIELSDEHSKSDTLIENKTDEQNIIIKKEAFETIDVENNVKNVNDIYYLPKLSFIDFLFNNIYNNKCCKKNRQHIINTCNEILSKYFSIENIIYNQMMLENLFKDYKWNNAKLSNFNDNQLVIQLKNLITLFNKN